MSRHSRDRAGLGRRKACDNCCRRKVRCDAKTPSCSTCTLRQVDCTWTPEAVAPKTAASTVQSEVMNEARFGELERRLAAIEARQQPSTWPVTIEQSPSSGWTWTETSETLNNPPSSIHHDLTALDDDSSTPMLHLIESSTRSYELPPWDQVVNLVTKYFQGPNEAIPIFDEPDFLRMLHGWRQSPEDRDEASWACINAVLAMSAHHTTDTGSKELVREALSRAQSVLNSLVTRDEDLKGIQVVLSLISVFLSTPHPQPTCVLIATAVKLAHRLRLHDREARTAVDAHLSLQMDRLFKITYMYDRDISLRAIEPTAQHEDDYDVPLLGSDSAGTLCINGIQINWFQLRLHLAQVQGLTYRTKFSVKARRLSSEQHELAAKHIDDLVQSWQDGIPVRLHPENILKGQQSESSAAHSHLVSLHLTAYQVRFLAHRVYARNPDWIRRLTDYSDQFVSSSVDDPVDPEMSPFSYISCSNLLIPNWTDFTSMARTCIRLIQMLDASMTAMIWSTLCTYQTALIILIAHRMTVWEHGLEDQLDSDTDLIEDATKRLQQLIERQAGEESIIILLSVHEACMELNRRADIAYRRFRVCRAV